MRGISAREESVTVASPLDGSNIVENVQYFKGEGFLEMKITAVALQQNYPDIKM